MSEFREIKILPYKAKEIFDLIMDIEKYPDFLPWCKSAKITRQISDQNLEADLAVSFKAFSEKYRSDVLYYEENGIYIIESSAIQGPFKRLYSKWTIKDSDDNSCEVEFDIEFEFNSIILQKMIGMIFAKATQKMMKSFEDRAKELYV